MKPTAWIALLAVLALAGPMRAARGVPPQVPELRRTMQEDAALHDVAFVDARRGWAVGDRGTIWHTGDGGQTWQLQQSGVDCTLASVCFVDAQTGWVAGGWAHPYTHTTSGVLLATRDGGRTWTPHRGMAFPALNRVRFLSAGEGWLVGEPSSAFASSVFVTEDGGRSWAPASGYNAHGWLAADFTDRTTGAVAGRSGSLAMVRRRALEPTRTAALELRGLRALRLRAPTAGWLVGDGGLVLATGDAGQSWQVPAVDPAAVSGPMFDWRALATHESQIWIAGSPGTRVLHSPDDGRSWQLLSTGQRVPLHGLCFLDGQQGWAVGALGTILHTSDGGQSWQRQRSGGSRAALLALCADATDMPLELLARLAGNDGYLAAAAIVARRDLESPSPGAAIADRRAHEALLAVGGSIAETAWSFPLRSAALDLPAARHVEGWDRANDGRGLDRLEALLVRQIRTWRPEIVLTHAARPQGDDPLGHMTNQVVLRAVERAGDPTRYPEQFVEMGLEPWTVQKVFGATRGAESGTFNVVTTQLAPRLACSLAEVGEAARGLLVERPELAPTAVGFRQFVDRLPQRSGGQDIIGGIVLHPGGDARRRLIDAPLLGLEGMRLAVERRRNTQAIIERAALSPEQTNRLLAQVGDLTRGLAPHQAGDVLFQLAQGCADAGRWEMAVELFGQLVNQYPEHRLSEPAALWLVQCWASAEVGWIMQRQRSSQRVDATSVVASTPAAALLKAGAVPDAAADPYPVKQAAWNELPTAVAAEAPNVGRIDTVQLEARAQRAVQVVRAIEPHFPVLVHSPPLQFPLATAQRRQGFHKSAERYYLQVARGEELGAWRANAAAELWLEQPQQAPPPKPLARVRRAGQPPRLDGRLDEPFWQRAEPLELRSPTRDDAAWPAVALIARDEEFLYLAVHCRRAPGAEYPPGEGPRPRDADLQPHDRVEFLFDLDRDYASHFRLVVDHRGWTAESCFGSPSWNPQWFVAAEGDDAGWCVEAAIPLEELTGQPVESRAVWAAGVQRIVPGVGFQSWTQPAAPEILPAGFGLLLFD